MANDLAGKWALILGASSGFGAAISRELASEGMNVLGVHLDRRSTMPAVEELVAEIEGKGVETRFFNVNAADAEKRREVVASARELVGDAAPIRTLVHSIAFGSLKPIVGDDAKASLSAAQIEMTLNVMASSLVYWTQDLLWSGLLGEGSRIFAMTSAGDRVAWPGYGAVSAAKCALEAYVRQLALELGPKGIAANSIRAGVTNTPAVRKIPGHEEMLEGAKRRNPGGRLTRPEDVAGAIVLLSMPGAAWISGNVIGVDGGEEVAG